MNKILSLVQVCDYYQFDIGLVYEFAEFGLYPTVELGSEKGVELRYLDRIKEVISLHQALGINKEGIDVILELRSAVGQLQEELESLHHENLKLRRLLGAEDGGDDEDRGLIIELILD